MEARGYQWRHRPETHPVYVARNQVVYRFLTEDTAKQHLAMIDAPLVPARFTVAGETPYSAANFSEVGNGSF